MFFSCECLCVVRLRSLRRADHTSRGVLLSVVCLSEDLETSKRRRPRPDLGCCATGKKENLTLKAINMYSSQTDPQ
jgi:hypothetical protein